MLKKLKPSVARNCLILLSAVMWSVIGAFLNFIASRWLPSFENWQVAFTYALGIVGGLIIAFFGFNNLAKKNRDRINQYPEKVCLFAFQRWQMYLLIAVMMTMGIYMRTSELIPKFLIAPVYVAIGLALVIGSWVYYKHLLDEKKDKNKKVC
jgi:uncharacterized membrane protein YkvI